MNFIVTFKKSFDILIKTLPAARQVQHKQNLRLFIYFTKLTGRHPWMASRKFEVIVLFSKLNFIWQYYDFRQPLHFLSKSFCV